MTINPEHLEAFTPLKWATPLLTSPDWTVRKRLRASSTDPTSDRFPRDTLSANDGMRLWIELYERPATGSSAVTRTVSLCQFGAGLTGFPTICHGGAVMTMMDEALAFAMCASEAAAAGKEFDDWSRAASEAQKEALGRGLPLEKILAGSFVTALLEVRFLMPVVCPGVVGIEVTVLESRRSKMKLRAVMKDGNGTPLVQTDSIWVRIGGAKL